MTNKNLSVQIDYIGIIHSPYNEKFCIPRQPALNHVVKAKIELLPPYNCQQAIAGLEQVSHLWVEFLFHQIEPKQTKLMVRPPRLGGNKKIGVLASRSPFRKNRLGLSLIKIEQILMQKGRYFIEFSGVDMLDKTPVIDIKPYLAYADMVEGSNVAYVTEKVERKFIVNYSKQALAILNKYDNMKQELDSILCYDIRPAYKSSLDDKIKFMYRNCDIVCNIQKTNVLVVTIN